MTQSKDHEYMQLALSEARKSPPRPTNFCVGAVLVSPSSSVPILATGYTLEEPGNTHAEQSAFAKLARVYSILHTDNIEERLGGHIPADTTLYTTMEPCNKRSPGNKTCVDRILHMKTSDGRPAIRRVCVGVSEPDTFVGINQGRAQLENAGIVFDIVAGLEEEILAVAKAGHVKA
ncbi:hypothetical protein AMS68_005248 [Peltaster fructicola]|uniref:CMP/dCMP-type deaminase domain-containing protein n=1 Tax=Peltaster fructicola TaxID=286661 RepID=A0A6H0XYI9_9PEZI|nr:hypothetical protein AMS68_005248 [Peltaster fructicola]